MTSRKELWYITTYCLNDPRIIKMSFRLLLLTWYIINTLSVPVSAVNIHMQSQYQYGNEDWINCTTDMMDSSKTSMHLEVCYNESMFLPITNVTSSLGVDIVSDWKNCSLHRMEGYRFHFNSKMNVSMRCRVDDHYFNTSVTSRCVLPNISVPLGKHIYSFFRYYFSPLSLMLNLFLSLLNKSVRYSDAEITVYLVFFNPLNFFCL